MRTSSSVSAMVDGSKGESLKQNVLDGGRNWKCKSLIDVSWTTLHMVAVRSWCQADLIGV